VLAARAQMARASVELIFLTVLIFLYCSAQKATERICNFETSAEPEN